MRFRDVIGQEEVKNQLRQAVQEGRIAHAQLFTGASGVGKLPLALAYAQYVCCAHRTDEDSCGVCATCRQYEQLQHPDLHFAFPIVKTDSSDVCDGFMRSWRELVLQQPYFDLDDWYRAIGVENKQGVIYEKESSEILRKLSLKSFSGGYKVMIIWLPEKMNISCSNKLLKLLEEPPEKTLFLLISEHPELLLSTIVSRTQEVRVPRICASAMSAAIRSYDSSLSSSSVEDIVHVSDGSYVSALRRMLHREGSEPFLEDFISLMRNAWLVGHKKDYSALQQLRQWSLAMSDEGREHQKAFLQYAQKQVRENFIYNFQRPEMNFQTESERNFSTKFARFVHEGNVEKLMNELGKAEIQIAQNGNAKIVFFDLCLQVIVLVK